MNDRWMMKDYCTAVASAVGRYCRYGVIELQTFLCDTSQKHILHHVGVTR